MRTDLLRAAYPRASRILQQLIDAGSPPTVVESLTRHALARIDSGQTPERDVRLLIAARAAELARRRAKSR